MIRRKWLAAAGLVLVSASLLLPRGWYDALPRQPHLAEPPIKGVTLLQGSIALQGVLVLWLASRRPSARAAVAAHADLVASPRGDAGDVSRHTAGWLLAAITLLGLGLRVWRLDADLWLDEITPIQDYGRIPFLHVVGSFYSSNNHLLNTLLTKVTVAVFGEQEWAIRAPAVLFGVATIPVLYRTARLATSRVVSLGAAFLLAVSYHHVFFSQNARGYSAYLCLALLASALFVRALQTDRYGRWALYIAAAVADVASLLHGAFVVAAHAIAGLCLVVAIARRGVTPWPLVRRLAAVFGIAGFLVFQLYATAIPRAFVVLRYVYTGEGSGFAPISVAFVQEVLQGISQGFGPGLLLGAIPFLVVAAGGFVLLLRRQWVLMAALTLPVVVTAAALLVTGLTFSPRFFLLALPAAILSAVEGIYAAVRLVASRARARQSGAVLVTVALLGVAGAMSVASLRRYYSIPKQPYRSSIEYVKAERKGKGAVVAIHLAEKGYLFYAPKLGLVQNEDFYLARSVAALDEIVAAHAGEPVYLVTTFPRYLRIHSPELEAMIASGWVVARTFPATVGDGEIKVWHPRRRNGRVSLR